jgi:hypothetical protein
MYISVYVYHIYAVLMTSMSTTHTLSNQNLCAMDGYPPGSLDHNVPLLVASGLVSAPAPDLGLGAAFDDQAVLIRSDLPPMQGRVAKVLADHLGVVDSRQDAWNGTDTGSGYKFRVITAGRVR